MSTTQQGPESVVHVPGQVLGQVQQELTSAQPGDKVLPYQVRQSMYESICCVMDNRGLVFEPTSSDPDPLGWVKLELDPSKFHESAGDTFKTELFMQLSHYGLRYWFVLRGSSRYSFGPGRSKEPDASLEFLPQTSASSPPVLAVEVAYSQSRSKLFEDLGIWVLPRPAGGGAKVAVGIDMDETATGWLRMTVYVATPTKPQVAVGDGLQCGEDTQCLAPGNPNFFVWLPLSALMPGSWWLTRVWIGARIAVGGLCASLLHFFPLPTLHAVYWAWRRAWAPWGAVHVDMFMVKRSVLCAR
mmetsp:Transcript_39180/g.87201  ORF Transcript_39180/g.87201 Transcript_39180/m.87201 type:complete len:300 (+) Transcript_39180:99-998(+)|eukprot:CAMPEP_0202892218 /NCGR_PEP_ID=MMETSP1392-20130828/1991_1 /ASSEMBLY_ACC=CAM_ASM_000868 /TAXON_ID=225041 /ORGANISM="Chlamydomonas chlamydogama, Strain SAG 11-48b" /LENGTH=299 /DNA_ID=CAMNT_0049576107 /DNA_START=93 /DNA_END=992 /DNA_ORIENTATION=+